MIIKPEISIIIVSYNVCHYLRYCVLSVSETCREISHEVIIIDNNSTDDTKEEIQKQYPSVIVIKNPNNVGFARANNQGILLSKGEFILLLNPDTIVKPSAVQVVLDFMKRTPDAGLAGCRLANTDGSLQKSIKRFPSIVNNLLISFCLDKIFHTSEWAVTYHREKPLKVDCVSGAFMMIRRKALDKEPYLFNPDFHMYSEEKDLALRLKVKGWNCYFVPGAEIVHHGGRSTGLMPEEMFLELQYSQVKFFYTHHKGFYARLLDLTWWLVIFCSWLKSLPISVFWGLSQRSAMMWRAVKKYPKFERPWNA